MSRMLVKSLWPDAYCDAQTITRQRPTQIKGLRRRRSKGPTSYTNYVIYIGDTEIASAKIESVAWARAALKLKEKP